MTFEVTGFKNPALAALFIAEHSSIPVDVDSFMRVADAIGESSPEVLRETGFTITETPMVEGFQILCDIGGFEIRLVDGALTCVLEHSRDTHAALATAEATGKVQS